METESMTRVMCAMETDQHVRMDQHFVNMVRLIVPEIAMATKLKTHVVFVARMDNLAPKTIALQALLTAMAIVMEVLALMHVEYVAVAAVRVSDVLMVRQPTVNKFVVVHWRTIHAVFVEVLEPRVQKNIVVTVLLIAMVSVMALQLLTPVMSVAAMDLVASAQTAI
jgi:hypothetical protein